MSYQTAYEAKQAILASGKAYHLSDEEINVTAAFMALHGEELDQVFTNIDTQEKGQ